ncbi:lipase family alpha/beta hydrolase [Geodermatophilus sp. SYSU D00766]
MRRRRWSLAAVLLAVLLTLGTAPLPAAAAPPPAGLNQACDTGMGTKLVVVLVHGFNSKSDAWQKAKDRLKGLSNGNLVHPVLFDYRNNATDWVTSAPVAPRLADTLNCLAKNSGRSGGPAQVVAVGHSMGGLAIRCALQPLCSGVSDVDRSVAQVITVGTPTAGSYLREGGWVNDIIRQAANAACRGGDILVGAPGFPSPCEFLEAFLSSDAAQAFYNQSRELYELRTGTTDVPILAIAGNFHLRVSVLGKTFNIGDGGDFVVGTDSQLTWATEQQTVDCGSLSFSVLTRRFGYNGSSIGPLPCWHMSETTNDDVLRRIETKVQQVAADLRDSVTLASLAYAPVPSVCDHPEGRLVNGVLTAPGEDAGTTRLGEVVFGNLDSDRGTEAVVTLLCDLGGNAVMASAHIYDSGPRHLGVLDLSAGRPIGRAWDIALGDIRIDGGVVTVFGLDGGDDDPVCCPTVHLGARFQVAGGTVTRLAATAPATGDSFHIDGLGSLTVGDTYDEAALATGWPIDVDYPFGDDEGCTYVTPVGAPDTLWAIGSDGRIRSLVVTAPGIATPSGVSVGMTEAEVLDAYADARVERVSNIYEPGDDLIVSAGSDGHVLRFQFDENRRVTLIHNGERDAALLPEGCA